MAKRRGLPIAMETAADRRRARCGTAVEHPFAAVGDGQSLDGPSSNTGHKSMPRGAIVDYVTVVFTREALHERGFGCVSVIVAGIFGLRDSDVRTTELRTKAWNRYTDSCYLIDACGEVVGHIGMGGNRDTVAIELTGKGCSYVENWHTVSCNVQALKGRISRCDVAYDDYDGRFGSVREHELKARQSLTDDGGCALFANGGRPPKTKFLDDHQSGDGCTLYVGRKGHKQLCIYEKGAQLGLKGDPWVRYEARLYRKHGEIPLAILTQPSKFLRGAYGYLCTLLASIGDAGACTIEYTKRAVEATGAAIVTWINRQGGPVVNLLMRACQTPDELWHFLAEHVARDKLPTRLKRICTAAQAPEYFRQTLYQEEQPCLL